MNQKEKKQEVIGQHTIAQIARLSSYVNIFSHH